MENGPVELANSIHINSMELEECQNVVVWWYVHELAIYNIQ